jgi:hypothetical protein
VLRNKSYIVNGQKEVVLHHYTIHVNWPCRTCLSPDHPTRVCKVSDDNKESERMKFTCQVETQREEGSGAGKRKSTGDGNASVMKQMEKLLRQESSKGELEPRTNRPKPALLRKAALQEVKGGQKATRPMVTLPLECQPLRQEAVRSAETKPPAEGDQREKEDQPEPTLRGKIAVWRHGQPRRLSLHMTA